jgi:2,4-dienoyl-CoA reductase-like NADH-dependent reductase (Old Yellow Enzyme family)
MTIRKRKLCYEQLKSITLIRSICDEQFVSFKSNRDGADDARPIPSECPYSRSVEVLPASSRGWGRSYITECTFVDHPAANGFLNAPAFYGEEALNAWGHVVDEVHAAGGKIMPQIWHAGPSRNIGTAPNEDVPSIGPMDVLDGARRVVTDMSHSDIEAVIRAFSKAAADAKRIGFDGVEIHGAHSYLIVNRPVPARHL